MGGKAIIFNAITALGPMALIKLLYTLLVINGAYNRAKI